MQQSEQSSTCRYLSVSFFSKYLPPPPPAFVGVYQTSSFVSHNYVTTVNFHSFKFLRDNYNNDLKKMAAEEQQYETRLISAVIVLFLFIFFVCFSVCLFVYHFKVPAFAARLFSSNNRISSVSLLVYFRGRGL